jgi:hypothetical protein
LAVTKLLECKFFFDIKTIAEKIVKDCQPSLITKRKVNLGNASGQVPMDTIAKMATIAAVIIAIIPIFLAKKSLDVANRSVGLAESTLQTTNKSLEHAQKGLEYTREGLKITKASLELTQKSFEITKENLDITKEAFQFELLRSKPKFRYALKAKIDQRQNMQNEIEATVELISGTRANDVNIIIEAGVIGTKGHNLVFSHWKDTMKVGGIVTFDKNKRHFIESINRNLEIIDPDVFSHKKLNLLKLYAKYCVRLPDKDIPFDDDQLGMSLQIIPDYE